MNNLVVLSETLAWMLSFACSWWNSLQLDSSTCKTRYENNRLEFLGSKGGGAMDEVRVCNASELCATPWYDKSHVAAFRSKTLCPASAPPREGILLPRELIQTE